MSRLEAERILHGAAERLGAPSGEVVVVWTGDPEIRALNRAFRGADHPTDVLSFPDGRAEPPLPARIGDIVISISTARRNARMGGHALRREAAHLLVHGFLHLLGYNHEVDDGEMEDLEKHLLSDLNVATRRRP